MEKELINNIYNEDCLETMKRIPDNYIDMVLTSPPYDKMRQYGGNKSYREKLKDTGYSFDFEEIANELNRILKPGGVIMWNIQDQIINGSKTGNSMRQALYFMDIGLRLHEHLIWQKTGTPFPSQHRYRNVWENMFIFSKGKPNTFNPILKKNKTGGRIWDNRKQRNQEGILEPTNKVIQVKEFGIDDNVWLIANGYKNAKEFKGIESHPAIFPDEIAIRHIMSWTNEGDIVYDPILGSATTTKIAKNLNRNWIGSEIHKAYFDICKKIMK
jgi:site-specific DNA-methyltransferase (adenine-specific)